MANISLEIFILFIIYAQHLHGLVRLNPYRHNIFELIKEPPVNVNNKASTAVVEELWLEQKVNHFDARNQKTWKMRYLRNSQYFRPNGPIYILVGGEWTISKSWLSHGLTHDMAMEMGGMLYYTEHRYYGKSWPVMNSSTSNLSYLSVRQALADLAHFIHIMKSENLALKYAKVILVGGSYAGSMVTWINRLYSHAITASWASSAPLRAKADFYGEYERTANEYMEVVADSITNAYGQNCSQCIERGMAALATNFKNLNSSKEILKRLNACDNFNIHNEYDIAALFNGIGNYFAHIVQSFSSHIPQLCQHLMSLQSKHDDGEALILYLSLLFALDNHIKSVGDCQDFSYQSMVEVFTDIEEQTSGTRQWFYQTCQEFGWYTITAREQITNIENAADEGGKLSFGSQVPLRYFERLCLDAFANGNESLSSSTSSTSSSSVYTLANMSLGISQTNALFGNNTNTYTNSNSNTINRNTKNVTSYENVFFTHGQLDPWRALGQQSGHNALVIPGYSHCADLGSIDIQDSVAMNSAKLQVMSFLRRHLA